MERRLTVPGHVLGVARAGLEQECSPAPGRAKGLDLRDEGLLRGWHRWNDFKANAEHAFRPDYHLLQVDLRDYPSRKSWHARGTPKAAQRSLKA